MARVLLALALITALCSSAIPAEAQAAPFCDPGQAPAFALGIASLKAAIGDTMGDPVECEHPNSANGDTLQQTTTGLAMYLEASNTPEFTDGWNHWALAGQGVVAWSGSDRPPTAAQPAAAPVPRSTGTQCVDVGASTCLNAPPELADTITLLSHTHAAQPLLLSAARDHYTVQFGSLPPDVLGLFSPSRHELVLSIDLKPYPSVDRGPVLAHELQHVSDWISQGSQLDTPAGCMATESNAFHTESATWLELRGGRITPAANDLEQEFNAITRSIQSDPQGFAARLTLLYHSECAGQ